MPRWAKIVLVVGILFYVLSFVFDMFNLMHPMYVFGR